MSTVDKQDLLKNIRRVAIDGFTGPNLAMLEYCLSSAIDCELVNSTQAEIVILNGDQPIAEDVLQSQAQERYEGKSKIVISVKDIDWRGFILVKKPHTADDLLATIRSIETTVGEHKEQLSPKSKLSSDVLPEDLDFYRGSGYSRKRQGEALKQKLIRGNLVVNAADRLVQKIETDLKAQEAELQAKLEEEKRQHEELEKAKRREKKIRELKKKALEEKRLEAKRKKLEEEKAKRLAEKKKQLAEERARKLEQKLKEQKLKKQQSKALDHKRLESEADKRTDGSKINVSVNDASLPDDYILQCCGNSANVDLNRHEERRRIFLNPEGSLLVKMKEAVQLSAQSERVVEISGLPGKILVSAERGKFYFNFADDFLNQLSLTKFGFAELELKPLEDIELDAQEFSSEAVDSSLWKVAIWTARGKIFQGMDPEKVLQLNTQPDFTRLILLPRGKEISELWSAHQLSALDVVRILDIPQRYVFSFMSGAFLLGWFQE